MLITTEGTYPHVIGGVSSWCDLLIGGLPEFDWQILPIVAGHDGKRPAFEVPAHAELLGRIDLWSSDSAPRGAASAGESRSVSPASCCAS